MEHKFKRSLADLLQISPTLSALTSRVRDLEKINQIILQKLEPEVAQNCQVANLRNGILYLATTSPAWHHQLRFLTSDLLSQLRTEPDWMGLKSIEIQVQQPSTPYVPLEQQPSKPQRLSKENAELLSEAAASLSNDKLSDALLKLAKHQR